jgi:LuxR family maltose regulon positive regulatory protein
MRAAAVLGLACARAGEVDAASRAFKKAIAAAEQAGIPSVSVAFWCNLADNQLAQGRLRQALESCDLAERAGTSDRATQEQDRAEPAYALGFVSLQRAKIAYERYELAAAQQHAQRGLDLLRRGHISLGTETLHALLACAHQGRGDSERASDQIAQALQIARGNDIPRLISLISAYQARIRLAQKRLAAATDWAQAYERMEETEHLREFEELTLARVHLAHGHPRQAQSVLGELLPPAEDAGRQATVIEGLALRALCQDALGKPGDALAALARALRLSAPEGIVRPFVEAGPPMAELLARALRAADSGAPVAFTRRLLIASGGRARMESPPESARRQVSPLIDPLTPREIQVLGLLAQGLTNAEIGKQLVISLPTVKSHTRNLYGKLGVHTRREAVARARELNLLGKSSLH